MDWSPQGSSVRGILLAKILEWVVISFSRESSRPRDQTRVSCIGGRFFTVLVSILISLVVWFPHRAQGDGDRRTVWTGELDCSRGVCEGD